MNKINGLFLVMLFLVGSLSFVLAEDGNAIPEARRIGFFENQMDHLRLAFTFNKEVKIDRVLEMAEKRLAEAEFFADNNPEAYEKAQARYEKLVARAEDILDNIESKGEHENVSFNDLEKIVRIQNKFEKHRDHIDAIYARARDRFEKNGASAEKIARFDKFHERALNRSYKIENRTLEKIRVIGSRHSALHNMTDAEIDELASQTEAIKGRIRAREIQHAVWMRNSFKNTNMTDEEIEERIENISMPEEMKAKIREELENINMTDGEKTQLRERVESANLSEEEKAQLKDRIKLAEHQFENISNRTLALPNM